MMKKYMPAGAKPGSKVKIEDKIKSKILKSELYLKYVLLVDLLKITWRGIAGTERWKSHRPNKFTRCDNDGQNKTARNRKRHPSSLWQEESDLFVQFAV